MGISISPAVALGLPFSGVSQNGAGRYRDYCFPEPAYLLATLGQTVSGQRQGNDGSTGFPLFARTTYTADPGGIGLAAFGGVNVATVLSGAAAGQAYSCSCVYPRLNPSFITVDEYAYWRIYWIMAVGNPVGGATTDIGGYIVNANSATPDMRVMGGISGFGFQFPTQSSVQFVAQGPNGRILTPIPSMTDLNLHCYELQITPSTSTKFAKLRALVDGVPIALPVASSSWEAGTNLPPLGIFANRLAFAAGVINNCLAVCNLLVAQAAGPRVICAPTYADLF